MNKLLSYFKKQIASKYYILVPAKYNSEAVSHITLVYGDITKQPDLDCIVNAANNTLLGSGGVDGAIHFAAGIELNNECRQIGHCANGEAVITNAYNLPNKKIIHTVGPIWHDPFVNDKDAMLATAYKNCLALAGNNNIKTIGFPSISTGEYEFPFERACKIAMNVVLKYLSEHPECFTEVRLIYYSEAEYNQAKKIFEEIIAFSH